jgi:carboxyl-terminal processing protease
LEKEYYDDEILNDSKADMIEWALVGYVWAIDDPHTVYLKKEDNAELMNELENKAGFAGIWAVIEKQENYVVISEVLKKSPAARAWLLPLDKIYMVEDKTLEDLTANEVVQLIRWEKWTEVTLFIERNWKNDEEDKRFFVTIERDDVSIPSVTSEIFEKDGKILLYLEISIISEKTTALLLEEVRDAVESTGKIDWIILDLRWNSWWYLEEAVKLLGHFFPKNEPLVKSKYKAFNDLDYNSEWRWELWNYPIVILVDQLTASAGEIIALKFQEEWKTIIWMQTFGKWSIQAVENFKDGSSLKYTVWKWYSPNDINIDKEWITPDVEVARDYEKYKEDWTDNQLEAAKEELLKLIK